MNVLLAHVFKTMTLDKPIVEIGWIEGKLIQSQNGPVARWDIINKEGNKLVQGATTGFLATLKNKGLLKEDDGHER